MEATEATPLASKDVASNSDVRGVIYRAALLALAFFAGGAAVLAKMKVGFTRTPPLASHTSIPPLDPTKSCPYYSPVYPSEGGADCPAKCSAHTSSVSSVFYYAHQTDTLDAIIAEAADIIQSFDPDEVSTTVFRDTEQHITFGYYCCQTDQELAIIESVLEQFEWNPINVSFSYVTCAMDGPSEDHVSLILMLDEDANISMMQLIKKVEAMIEIEASSNSLEELPLLNVPRERQEPFHTTLAVVRGSTYPVEDAVKEINDRLAKVQLSAESLTLTRPCRRDGVEGAHGHGMFC